jgi:hypothetical protein
MNDRAVDSCFTIFAECYRAIKAGERIVRESTADKEFHFQNWFEARLQTMGLGYERRGRNTYPDFVLIDRPAGYEIKGLAYPGREANYDANSQLPTGKHSGREIYYVFGRYPDTKEPRYEVIDLIICHGSFLNADDEYVHKNRHVKGFGSYGDIMIRDRKMYVVPTPMALTNGTQGYVTLITPASVAPPDNVVSVGELVRREADRLVVGYEFNLQTNVITPKYAPNPNTRREHRFVAYRMETDNERQVTLQDVAAVVAEQEELLADDNEG